MKEAPGMSEFLSKISSEKPDSTSPLAKIKEKPTSLKQETAAKPEIATQNALQPSKLSPLSIISDAQELNSERLTPTPIQPAFN